MDACQVFSEALEAEGLDAEVAHSKDPTRQADEFTIKKTINGENHYHRTMMAFPVTMDDDTRRQRIATEARMITKKFEAALTETIEWDDKVVHVDHKDTHSATCYRCGTEVSLDDLPDEERHLTMAESSIPKPPSPDYSSLPDTKIRFVLIALLRKRCDPMCENSNRDPFNHRKT